MGESITFYTSDEELIAWMEGRKEELGFDSRSEMIKSALYLFRKDMAEVPNYISAEIDDDELANWAKMKYEKGEFYNEEHLIQVALKRMKDDDKGQELV